MSFIADLFEKYEYKNGSVVDKVRQFSKTFHTVSLIDFYF